MTTLVQQYLLTHSLADLAREHGVYAGIAPKARYKASLNYDQIEAKESDPLARQCRGLVLARIARPAGYDGVFAFDFGSDGDVVGETIVLARPFDRFFNHGQHGTDAAAHLGKPGTRVFEKLDGTLCIVYFDDLQRKWHVATRSVPEADKPIDGFGEHTFRSLFDHALKEHLNLTIDHLASVLDPQITYLFELTTPQNRVVVEYTRPQVHLLAMRHRDGTELCPVENARHFGEFSIPRAPQYDCSTLAELIGLVTTRDPKTSEGVVVRAADFSRVKVKSPAYVALSALRGSVAGSPRRLLEVVLLGKEDDVLPMLAPEVGALGERYKREYAALCVAMDATYDSLIAATAGEANQRKAIALICQREKLWIPPVMDRLSGRSTSFRDYVEQRRDNTGGWPGAFLDTLLNVLPKEMPPCLKARQ